MGVVPNRENAVTGRYRLVEDYSLVFKKPLTPAAGRFVEFVFSPAGRKIIDGSGLIAVERR